MANDLGDGRGRLGSNCVRPRARSSCRAAVSGGRALMSLAGLEAGTVPDGP